MKDATSLQEKKSVFSRACLPSPTSWRPVISRADKGNAFRNVLFFVFHIVEYFFISFFTFVILHHLHHLAFLATPHAFPRISDQAGGK